MISFGKRILACVLSTGMILSGIPAGVSLAAESVDTVYAAAYQYAADTTGTTLPTTIDIDGTQTPVEWSLKSNTFTIPYDTVQITGIAGSTTVTAKVEVIPKAENELVYFVDASRDSGKASYSYPSISALSGESLRNLVPDQAFTTGSGWGRTGGNFLEKSTSNVDITDKYQTGWYSSSKTIALTYEYNLDAGDYTLSAGFYEWWNGRSMKLALSGNGMTSVTSEAAAVSGIGDSALRSVNFTVTSPCKVTMQVENATGGEAPVISWFAIAKGDVEFPDRPAQEVDLIINGDDIETAAANINGLTYKGYGLLSANSTSNLLMDYKAESPEAYEEMLQVLFGGEHPLINHVKMEMGNDGNNSTGADAKAINPDVKVSFLRWGMPAWVGSAWSSNRTTAGYNAVYKWYRETVFDAYEKYGYVIDYINPDTNETEDPDEAFIKWFKNKLTSENDFPDYMSDPAVQEAYRNIKIIASDENTTLNIVPKMRSDAALYNAVDAIGFHYRAGDESSTSDYRRMADVDDKEVWYSEGCATFSYTEYHENKNVEYESETIGGFQSTLALAYNFIKSFVYSRKAHYIFQPAIGSFYEGAQYDHKEIISAREPWAGYIHYDPMIYMLQHFSKFSVVGWENEDNDAGIWRVISSASANGSTGSDHLKNEKGNPSYMTLAAPDKSDFSVVMVNNSNKPLIYNVKAINMDTPDSTMEIWETKADSYMQYKGEAEYIDGFYTIAVEPFSMVTLTTLDCDGKSEYTERLPEEREKTVLDTDATGKNPDTSDDILYADDFEYEEYSGYSAYGEDYLTSRGNEPRNTMDFSGAFVVENGQMKQLLRQSVSQWNNNEPNCVIGDFRWMNYKASVDVTVNSGYAAINIRQQTGMNFEGSGYNLRITKNGSWILKKRGNTVKTGTVTANAEGKYNLALEGKGATITAWVDGVIVHSYTDTTPEYLGRVRLGCGWNETSFDNLIVEKVDGFNPYATALIDNASDDVSYTGSWKITVAGEGASSNDWYRSLSTTSTAGSTFQFAMTGGGFALISPNSGNAKLDIAVDGETIATNASTQSSNQHCITYLQSGLKDRTNNLDIDDTHDVTVTVKSGTLVLDAIAFLKADSDKTDLMTAIDTAKALDSSQYTEDSYERVITALTAAENILKNANATSEEINEALQALKDAIEQLTNNETPIEADKTALQTAYNSAKALNANDYTSDSFAKVTAALAEAENVLKNLDATPAEVSAALTVLNNAIANLKEKPVPPIQTIKLAAPAIKSLKSQASKTGSLVKITIEKVQYADSYIVYRKIGSKVIKIGTTTNGTIEDKKPVSNKKASYYAVAASKDAEYTDSAEGKSKEITLAKNTSKVKDKKSYYYKVITVGNNKTYSNGKISAKIKK